jgi:hypothetical protein
MVIYIIPIIWINLNWFLWWYPGSKVHNSIREDKYGESYAPGDVVGCFIKLDDTNENNNEIRFFKNGKCQGVAYSGNIITTAIYFPAVSIYMKVNLFVIFGEDYYYIW